MATFYTYLWLREDGTPYYVGKGKDNRAFRKGSPPADRILLQDYPDEQSALAAETFLISYYGRSDMSSGCLHNHTDGGDGIANPSSITRAKMSVAAKRTRNALGKKRTPEQKKLLSESHKGQIPWTKGNHHSDKTRMRMSSDRTGRTNISPEQYAELGRRFSGKGNPFFGKKHSAETLHKLREKLRGRKVWNKGVPCTEERRKILSALWKGKPWSEKRRAACGKPTIIPKCDAG